MKLPLALGAALLVLCVSRLTVADEVPCPAGAPCDDVVYTAAEPPSWVFRRGTYTHDPYTGARVAQYMRTPPVEPLDDERLVTSRYRRSRTNIRGPHGSIDTYYEVQAWGNGRGGLDAEWERFHDAWKESFLQGGWHHQGPWVAPPWGFGGFAPGHGFGHPAYGFPGHGFPTHPGRPWPGGLQPRHGGHGHHHRHNLDADSP